MLIDILFSNRGTLKRAFGEFSNSDITNDFYDIFRIFKLNCFQKRHIESRGSDFD